MNTVNNGQKSNKTPKQKIKINFLLMVYILTISGLHAWIQENWSLLEQLYEKKKL